MSKLVLGKTAAKLLLKAAKHGTVVVGLVRAPHRKLAGIREWDAATALAKGGLLLLEDKRSDVSYRAGWGTHRSEARYRITDAGRAALAGRAP